MNYPFFKKIIFYPLGFVFLTIWGIFGIFFMNARADIPADLTTPVIAPTGGPQTLTELLELLTRLSGWMFAFVLVLAVGAIIAGGIMYVTSGGNDKRTGTAAKMVIYAIVGIAVAGFAWAMINVTGNLIFGETLIPTESGGGPTCSGNTPVACISNGKCYADVPTCVADGCKKSNCVQ